MKTGVAEIKRQPIKDRAWAKWFSLVHKSNLVYNTCWEDPRLDRVALELSGDDTVVVITSAGCNTLDYVLQSPKRVHAVDMNPRQNALLEMKVAGIRELNHSDFFKMFGEGRLPGFREVYRDKLRRHLTPGSQKYWDRKGKFFDSKRTFYFRGSSGTVARFFNYYIDRVVKVRDSIDEMFASKSLEEQREIYETKIRPVFWTKFIRRFIGSNAALSMVGVPRPQRQQVELHYGRGIEEFVEDCFETVFAKLPIHDNYFYRVYLCGSYSPECCPEYLKPDNFQQLKDGLVDRISIHTNTIEGFLTSNPEEKITRYILLDHMDWLSTYRYEALVSEWQAIVDRASEHARILFRSGGTKVEFVDPIQVDVNGERRRVGDMLTYNTNLAAELHEIDRVHTYGSFYIADLRK